MEILGICHLPRFVGPSCCQDVLFACVTETTGLSRNTRSRSTDPPSPGHEAGPRIPHRSHPLWPLARGRGPLQNGHAPHPAEEQTSTKESHADEARRRFETGSRCAGQSWISAELCEPPGGAGVRHVGPRRAVPTRPQGLARKRGSCDSRWRVYSRRTGRDFLSILRKEVIQPQVPLRLPCYDLVPITGFIFGACLAAPATSDAPRFGGLTGGVYKAQEHIHRGMLIRDY